MVQKREAKCFSTTNSLNISRPLILIYIKPLSWILDSVQIKFITENPWSKFILYENSAVTKEQVREKRSRPLSCIHSWNIKMKEVIKVKEW